MDKSKTVRDLVAAHTKIDDEEMLTAIWIRQAEAPVWLVELLPGFADDDRVEEPTVMAAGKQLRFDLHLVAGNEKSLRDGIKRDVDLAKAIVEGEIIFGNEKGGELQTFAKQCVEAAAQARHA